MNKAVLYCRVSTMEQANQGVSLDAQERKLRAYCDMKGLDVVAVIREEGISGGKPLHERPGGRQLVDMIDRRAVGHVVAFKLDRLFRSAGDCAIRVDQWVRRGVEVHLLDVSLDTSSAYGRFQLNLLAALSELERGLISERTAAALGHKRDQLEVYAPTPFGYDREGKRLEENPDEKDVVARILRMRAQGMSYHQIARALNNEKIPTKNGARWYASTIRNICLNPIHKRKPAG